METGTQTARLTATETAPQQQSTFGAIVRDHWREYLCEAAGLGLFMIAACAFGVLLEHPSSAIQQSIESPLTRRIIGGIVMGITAIAIFTSPFGKRSGAHINPAVTLNYCILGKIRKVDAVFYMGSQFLGGITGVIIADILIGYPLRHSAVNYAVTVPGAGGASIAFLGEFAISFLMMIVILLVSNTRGLSRFTPLFAGALVAAFIAIESPVSGMSMNPARTLGSAFSAHEWTAVWVYFTAPTLAMIVAGQVFKALFGARAIYCAKLHHHNNHRCIFRCNYGGM